MKIRASEAKPGQWYEVHDIRCLCFGTEITGCYVVYEDGSTSFWRESEITHLPNCTGWDDPLPLHPTIPEGWEIRPGKTAKPGDKYFMHDVDFDWCDLNRDSNGEYEFRSPVTIIRHIEPAIPDPGEGYRIATGEDWRDERCEAWLPTDSGGRWDGRVRIGQPFVEGVHYRIPIDPPSPKYRPFANAAEFRPHRERWWRYDAIEPTSRARAPVDYDDSGHWEESWEESFKTKVFEDGTPFGVEVTT